MCNFGLDCVDEADAKGEVLAGKKHAVKKAPQVANSLLTGGANSSQSPCIFISESMQGGNLLELCAGLQHVLPLRTNESPP